MTKTTDKYVVVSEHPETFDSYVKEQPDNPYGWTWTSKLEEATRVSRETALNWAKALRKKYYVKARIRKDSS